MNVMRSTLLSPDIEPVHRPLTGSPSNTTSDCWVAGVRSRLRPVPPSRPLLALRVTSLHPLWDKNILAGCYSGSTTSI